jgi:hypothetical protein
MLQHQSYQASLKDVHLPSALSLSQAQFDHEITVRLPSIYIFLFLVFNKGLRTTNRTSTIPSITGVNSISPQPFCASQTRQMGYLRRCRCFCITGRRWWVFGLTPWRRVMTSRWPRCLSTYFVSIILVVD